MKSVLFFRRCVKKMIRFVAHLKRSNYLTVWKRSAPRHAAYFIRGGIGDVMMAIPAIGFLKRTLPGTRIDIFIPPDKLELFSVLMPEFRAYPFTFMRIFSLICIRTLKPFDMALTNTIAGFSLRIEIVSALISRLSGGFHYPDESSSDRLYTFSAPLKPAIHDIDQNLDLAANVLKQHVCESDRIFQDRGDSAIKRNRTAILHPGAERGTERKWPVQNYIGLIKHLVSENWNVKILIGPCESDLKPVFLGCPGIQLVENPGIPQLIDEFRKASLFIGNDSGPGHIAAFCGTSGISIHGPTDPVRSAPRAENWIALYSKETCSPCHFSVVACSNNRCMQNITVDMVIEAAGMLCSAV